MKRIIITSLLTAFLMNMSAQESTRLDNMFNELRTIIHSGIYSIRGNYGLGQTVTQTQVPVFSNELCSEDICGEPGPASIDSTMDVTKVSERHRAIWDRMLSIIRRNLDSIAALPDVEESYRFESHHQGIDTIRYSICLHSGKERQKHEDGQGGYFYEEVPGAETVTFNYDTKLKPCGKHFEARGTLAYSRTESVPGNKSVPFNWEKYMETLRPILNRQGITQKTFKWAQDADYGNEDDYAFKMTMIRNEGINSAKGETNGTIYFIPADQLEFAQAVLHDINFATQHYIYNHPQQTYQYNYDTHFSATFNSEYPPKENMLRTMNFDDPYHQHSIIVCSDVQGYYFLFCDTYGSMWVPCESLILKSFINGKKKYFPGMKPKKGK